MGHIMRKGGLETLTLTRYQSAFTDLMIDFSVDKIFWGDYFCGEVPQNHIAG